MSGLALPIIRSRKHKLIFVSLAVILTTAILGGAYYLANRDAGATLTGFQAGDIMSDAVMGNKMAMTESQIQSFLKNQADSCTSKGPYSGGSYYYDKLAKSSDGKTAYDGSYIWNIKNGHFVCMADDKFGGETAAHIIWQAAQDYNINPQVLIVLLQKEQGLVTDGFPNNHQYLAATGYDCPDNGNGCNNSNAGFKTQIRKAAALFHEVLTGGWTNYPVGSNFIKYNPSDSCGGTVVNVANRATSALYRYTPYQPNKAALDAGYGSGNSCSAYGNRNFYNYFTDWFGNTHAAIGVTPIEITTAGPYIDSPVTATYYITNYTKKAVNLGKMGLAVRDVNNKNVDFDYVDSVTIAAGKTYKYTSTKTLSELGGAEGQFHFYVARYAGGKWHNPTFDDYNQTGSGDLYLAIGKKPTVISSISTSKQSIHANEPFNVSFTVKNNSAVYSRSLGTLGISARSTDTKNTTNYDIGGWTDVTLSPNQSQTITGTRSLPEGTYKLWIANLGTNGKWNDTLPANANGSIVRTQTITVKPQVTLTSALNVTGSLHETNTLTATFTVKNFGTTSQNIGTVGISARSTNSKDKTNYDFSGWSNTALSPGEERTITATKTLPAGTYKLWIANLGTNGKWNDTLPQSENTNLVVRAVTITVRSQVTVTSGLVISDDNHAGHNLTATFTVKNNGTTTKSLGTLGVAARSTDTKNTTNYDIGGWTDVTLTAGQSKTITAHRSLPAGKYRVWISNLGTNGKWSNTEPASENSSITRTSNVEVKPQVTVTSGLVVSADPENPMSITATFTVKNFGTTSQNIGTVGISARSTNSKDKTNYDFSGWSNTALSPGEERTITATKTLPAGTYKLWIANLGTNGKWNDTLPQSENTNLVRSLNVSVK